MLDSINFSINNVKKNQIYNFTKRFRRCSKNVYTYNYKGIHWNYYTYGKGCLTLQTHTFTILKKIDVTENDVTEYLNTLERIIKEIVNLDDIKLTLTRCDYCIDLKIPSEEELNEIFILLNKHCTKFRYIESRQQYENGIYLVRPKSSMCINIYNKYEQLLNVYGTEDVNFKNVVRMELQLKNSKLKRLYKRDELERNILTYWNRETMEKQYFNYLQDYLYKGDYYKLSKAISLILASPYSNTVKKGLINFIKVVNLHGMTKASSTCSYNTIKKYIRLLDQIKVNPITIDDDSAIVKITNLSNQARKFAEETKFNKNI